MDINAFVKLLGSSDLYSKLGRIERIIGTTIEADGPPGNIGDVCQLILSDNDKPISAEVVGFKENKVLLMPFADIEGIGKGSIVKNTGGQLKVGMGDSLIGRIVDALGNPIDGGPPIENVVFRSIGGVPSNPMERPPITEVIEIGVKAIDAFLTVGKGQRIGIFAGSGVGKSVLMGMIARNVVADVNVIALVGERGRELVEFVKRDLGEEGLARSVVVVATSDQPSMMRSKCALTATAIAEYFKDKGNDVLLMMDSLTRYAMAQREIGLSIGEAPVARGYTPSLYTVMPKLLERCGNFENGSITGIYTVLVEGDDVNEPISDTVRGIIDGHIILSREIAAQNQYPAIDVLGSISRLMNSVADGGHKDLASRFRNMLSTYNANRDLVMIGAYKTGANPALDNAIRHIEQMTDFLKQGINDKITFEKMLEELEKSIS